MSRVVIHGEGLGKSYHRGALQQSTLLRDHLSRMLKSPLSVFRRPKDETFWAVKDVSLEVREGEVLGLIGRNGAGKTTLLKILSRITKPTTGWAEIHGRVGSLLEVGTGFHPELTGRENTFLSGAILGMSKREIARKFDEIVAFAELEKFIDTSVKHYSSGMYVRLAFAVAAHLEPEILLVDEVLAVGDAAFQEKCMGKMNDVSRAGRTVVLVTHNMGAITQLCKRCILVDQGTILAAGSPEATVTKYLSSFVVTGTSVSFSSDANPSSPAIIQRIWIADEDGRSVPMADVRKGFHVGIQVLVRQKSTNLDVGFRIDNSLKVPLLTSRLADSEEISQGMTTGEHVFLVPVPGSFLAPGLYSLTVALHRPNVEVYDWHEHALSFRVEESGSNMWQYESSGYGNILVNFPWRRIASQGVFHG